MSLVYLTVLCFTGYAVSGWRLEGILIGVGTHMLLSVVVVRVILCSAHRRGIRLVRAGRFEEAMVAFKDSQQFWQRHPLIDRYRAFLLATATEQSFRTMARYNEAYCLVRLNRGAEALGILDTLLVENPSNVLAASLKSAMQAGRNLTPDGEASPPSKFGV